MCGCGRTSNWSAGCTCTGPKWSKNRKGPTACRCAAGRARRTRKPPPRSLVWGEITVQAVMGCAPCEMDERPVPSGRQASEPGLLGQAGSGSCNAGAKGLGTVQVALRHFGRRAVRGALGHGAQRGTQHIRIVALSGLAVARQLAQTHPQATVLHGQGHQVLQGALLVAVQGGAVGETGKQLVLPGPGEPGLGAGVGKLLELPA